MNHMTHLGDALALAAMTRPLWDEVNRRIDASGDPVARGDDGLREKLAEVEGEISDLRSDLAVKTRAVEAAKEKVAASTGPMNVTDPTFKAAQDAVRARGDVADRLEAATQAQIGLLKLMGKNPGAAAAARGSDPSFPGGGRWDATELLAGGVQEQLAAIASSSMSAGQRVPIGQLIGRDALAASFGAGAMTAAVSGTDNLRRNSFVAVAEQMRGSLALLDLIPTDVMDGRSVPYTVESGPNTAAAETAEGALKPEASLSLTDAEAPARAIAHWMKVHRQSLADAPALRALLENRLRFGTLRRLQDAIIAGSGSGANLRGITQTPGIGAVAYDADELAADQVLRGVTTVMLADGTANAIVLNPADWRDALLAKAAGDGHYFSGGPFMPTAPTMWGVPLVPSNAIAAGSALVGDWAMGCQLFIREGVQVLLSDSDGDDFVHNELTMLAELRAALAVFRPAAFCLVDLAA